MAFLLKERNLRKLKLGEDELPWWDHGKHLGNKIDNSNNGMAQDLMEKRARYIGRNNEICQEFFFSHPKSLFKLNEIYNSHFTGSPLWDLFGPEAKQLEKPGILRSKFCMDYQERLILTLLKLLVKDPISKLF